MFSLMLVFCKIFITITVSSSSYRVKSHVRIVEEGKGPHNLRHGLFWSFAAVSTQQLFAAGLKQGISPNDQYGLRRCSSCARRPFLFQHNCTAASQLQCAVMMSKWNQSVHMRIRVWLAAVHSWKSLLWDIILKKQKTSFNIIIIQWEKSWRDKEENHLIQCTVIVQRF